MKTKLISANVDLFTDSFGNPEHPAILLIMGAMASGVWWPKDFCERLAARGLFVIRYDHRDTGGSTSYAPGEIHYSVEDLADDAVAVLDGYGLRQAHLAGMSLGGFLAQMIALKHPDRVLSLTLVSSEPLASPDSAETWIDPSVLEYHSKAATLDWKDTEAVLEYQIGAWKLLNGSAHPFDEAHIRELAAEDSARTPDPLTPFNHAQLKGGEAWMDRLGEIHIPTLIIHGTEDIVLQYSRALALHAGIPHSKLVTLEGSGHELHPDDWGTIINAIADHTS